MVRVLVAFLVLITILAGRLPARAGSPDVIDPCGMRAGPALESAGGAVAPLNCGAWNGPAPSPPREILEDPFSEPDFLQLARDIPSFFRLPSQFDGRQDDVKVRLYPYRERIPCSDPAARLIDPTCPDKAVVEVVVIQAVFGPTFRFIRGVMDPNKEPDDTKWVVKTALKYAIILTAARLIEKQSEKWLDAWQEDGECRREFSSTCQQKIVTKGAVDPKVAQQLKARVEADMDRERVWAQAHMAEGYTVLALTLGKVDVTRNGQTLPALDVSPYRNGNRAYIPLRFLAEYIGAQVSSEWRCDDQGCSAVGIAKFPSTTLEFPDRREFYLKDGRKVPMVVQGDMTLLPVDIQGGRIHLPLRIAAEALGARVLWSEATQRIALAFKAG